MSATPHVGFDLQFHSIYQCNATTVFIYARLSISLIMITSSSTQSTLDTLASQELEIYNAQASASKIESNSMV
jgi:hypothetical protein